MQIVIDIVLCVLAVLFFFVGYHKGFLKKAWWLVDLAVIVLLFTLLSPTILKVITEKTDIRTTLINTFGGISESIPQLSAEAITDFILNVGICLVLGVAVIIVMAILKLIIKLFIKISFFRFIDKILGGVFVVVLFIVILLVIGALFGTFTTFAPIKSVVDMFSESAMGKFFVGSNPLQGIVDKYVPLGTWIAGLVK